MLCEWRDICALSPAYESELRSFGVYDLLGARVWTGEFFSLHQKGEGFTVFICWLRELKLTAKSLLSVISRSSVQNYCFYFTFFFGPLLSHTHCLECHLASPNNFFLFQINFAGLWIVLISLYPSESTFLHSVRRH